VKVLIIGSRIPFPLHDGGAIATFNLLKGLTDIGIETTYISLNTLKHFADQQTIQNEFGFLESIIPYQIDTKIRPLKALANLFGNASYNIERFYDPGFEALLIQHLQQNTYDIVHFEGLFATPYIDAIKRQTNVPTLLRQHNIEYQIWERLAKNEKQPIKKWYLKLLAKRMKRYELMAIQKFDRLVCIAETDEMVLQQFTNHNKIETIPGGFIIKEADLKIQTPTANAIYHIGSMEWLPNQQAMEWFHNFVWPKVIQQLPLAQFFMAGKNMPEAYQSWATANFKVMGEVEDAHAFAADKAILIVPLQSGSGIRMKTIEAMLMGKAVVTTSIGAQGLPIKNHEHCVIADAAEDFAKAIIDLLNNPEKINELGKAAQDLMLNFYDNKKVSALWLSCYQSMLR
jgi:glycosyltransferase involved in cell wall biosynthesis